MSPLRYTMLLLVLLLSATADGPLAAAEQVGPFELGRKLLDPAAPQPQAIAGDGSVEDAVLVEGDATQGSIRTRQWSGTTQYGDRAWGATSLMGPADTAYQLTWTPWAITQRIELLSGAWPSYPRFMQDAHLRVAYLAGERNGFVVGDGTGFGLDGPFPAAAIVVELAFRNWQGGGTRFQTGDYNGSPLQVGVWQVAAGQTLQQAQQTDANRLSSLAIFQQVAPDRPIALEFQVGEGDGSWQVAVDLLDDGIVDWTALSGVGSAQTGPTGISPASGVLLTCVPAGGNDTGFVGESTMTIGYVQVPVAPIVAAIDRRPLDVALPDASRISPLTIDGLRWPGETVSVSADGAAVAVAGIGPVAFVADVALDPLAGTAIRVEQSGTPTTVVDRTVIWEPTDLYADGATTLRVGDSLLWTYHYTCGVAPSGPAVAIDADGDGTPDSSGPCGEFFPHRYDQPGVYTVTATLDGAVVGTHVVTVVGVRLPDRIAAEVGFARQVFIDAGAFDPTGLWYGSAVPGELVVHLQESAGNQALITVAPQQRGHPFLVIRLGDENGPILASQEIHEFELALGGKGVIGFDLATGLGTSRLRMRPYLPDVTFEFTAFAGKVGFLGGAKSFTVDSSAATTSLGEPGFVQGEADPNGAAGETTGWLTYSMEAGIDRSQPGKTGAYCFRVGATEVDETGPSGGSSEADIADEDSVNGCPVWAFKSLVFTEEDPTPCAEPGVLCNDPDNPPASIPKCGVGENEQFPIRKHEDGACRMYCTINGEYWQEWSWPLIAEEGAADASVDYRLVVESVTAVELAAAAAVIDNPEAALFNSDSQYSYCEPCDQQCGPIDPDMFSGTIPRHYTTSIELCPDEDDDDGEQGELTETTGGEFWVSKLDAHGAEIMGGRAADGTRRKFPDHTEVLAKRPGTPCEPVIQLGPGGYLYPEGGTCLYGIAPPGPLGSGEIPAPPTCPHPCDNQERAKWTFTAVATTGGGEWGTGPGQLQIRWRLSNGQYPSCGDGEQSQIAFGYYVKERVGGQPVTIEACFPEGRWIPRLEIIRDGKLVGVAELHSLALERIETHHLPAENDAVDAALLRGKAFQLTNICAGEPVDARLSARFIKPAELPEGATPPRARVSLDGYAQNQYWVGPNDGEDLAQLLRVDDEGDPEYAPILYLQGYQAPSVAADDLQLEVFGQHLIEQCDPCPHWSFKGSPVGPSTWAIGAGDSVSVVMESEGGSPWRLTDREVFNAVCQDLIVPDRDVSDKDGVTTVTGTNRRTFVQLSSPRPGFAEVDVSGSLAVTGEGGDASYMATVTISGHVTDLIADTVDRAKGADLASLLVYVNGGLDRTATLTNRNGTPRSFWRPYPYEGGFSIELTVPFNHEAAEVRLVTSPNAAGNEGWLSLHLGHDRATGDLAWHIVDQTNHGLYEPFALRQLGWQQPDSDSEPSRNLIGVRIEGIDEEIVPDNEGAPGVTWVGICSDPDDKATIFTFLPDKHDRTKASVCWYSGTEDRFVRQPVTLIRPEAEPVDDEERLNIQLTNIFQKPFAEITPRVGPQVYLQFGDSRVRERRHGAGMASYIVRSALCTEDLAPAEIPLDERVPVALALQPCRMGCAKQVTLRRDNQNVSIWTAAQGGEAIMPYAEGPDEKTWDLADLPDTVYLEFLRDADVELLLSTADEVPANRSESPTTRLIDCGSDPGWRDAVFSLDVIRVSGGLGAGDGASPIRGIAPHLARLHTSRGNLSFGMADTSYDTPVLNPAVALSFNSFDALRQSVAIGWRTNYDMKVYGPFRNPEVMPIDALGIPDETDVPVVLVDESGQRHVYRQAGVAEDGQPTYTITGISSQVGTYVKQDLVRGTWTLIRFDNQHHHFDEDGYLDTIRRIDGERLAVSRNRTKTPSIVVDHFARSESVASAHFGQGQGAFHGYTQIKQDVPRRSLLRPWTIDYHPKDDPGAFMPAVAQLDHPTLPQTLRYAFDYEAAHAPRLDRVGHPTPTTPDWQGGGELENRIAYTPAGTLRPATSTTISEIFGGSSSYEIDPRDDFLTSMTDALAVTVVHELQQSCAGGVGVHRVKKTTMGRQVTERTFDAHGNTTRSTIEGGDHQLESTATYAGLAGVEGSDLLVDQVVRGVHTSYEHHNDGFGQPRTGTTASLTTPVGTETHTRNANGFLHLLDDLRDKVWTYHTEPLERFGRWTKCRTPAGREERQQWHDDDWAKLHVTTDIYGIHNTLAFDGRNRAVVHRPFDTAPGNETVGWDILDRALVTSDAGGVAVETEFNVLGMVFRTGSDAGGWQTIRCTVNGEGLFRQSYQGKDFDVEIGREQLASGLRRSWVERPISLASQSWVRSTFGYTAAESWLETLTDPRGAEVRIAYFPSGLRQSTRNPEGGVTTYTYDGNGRPSAVEDPDGVKQTQTWDEAARPLCTASDGRGQVDRTYEGPLPDTVTVAGRGTTDQDHEDDGFVAQVVDPDSFTSAQTVDAAQREVRTTVHNGSGDEALRSTATINDNRHIGSAQVQYDGNSDAQLQMTMLSLGPYLDPAGRRIQEQGGEIDHTLRGERTDPQDPNYIGAVSQSTPQGVTQTSSSTRDDLWRVPVSSTRNELAMEHAPNPVTGEINTLSDDNAGGQQAIQTVLERDLSGNVTRYRDQDGLIWQSSYDLDGRVVETRAPDGQITRLSYTDGGRVTRTVRTASDGSGSKVSTTQYDSAMRPTVSISPAGVRTQRSYDDVGRVVSESVGPLTTTRGYDAAGHLVRSTAPGGLTTTYEFVDGFVAKVTDPRGLVIEMIRTSSGRLETWRSLVLERSYTYTPSGAVETITERPLGTAAAGWDGVPRKTSFTYFPDGSVQTMTVDGTTVTYGYDAYGRVTSQSVVGPDTDGSVSYSYDARGRQTSFNLSGMGTVQTIYEYGGHGSRVVTHGPMSYSYDQGTGLLQSASHAIRGHAIYEYDGFSRVSAVQLPNNVVRRFAYDMDDRVTEQADFRGASLLARSRNTYDSIGRLVDQEQFSTVDGTARYAYAFDGAGRLASEAREGPEPYRFRYTYDADGNRLEKHASTNPSLGAIELVVFDPESAVDNALRAERLPADLVASDGDPAGATHPWYIDYVPPSPGADPADPTDDIPASGDRTLRLYPLSPPDPLPVVDQDFAALPVSADPGGLSFSGLAALRLCFAGDPTLGGDPAVLVGEGGLAFGTGLQQVRATVQAQYGAVDPTTATEVPVQVRLRLSWSALGVEQESFGDWVELGVFDADSATALRNVVLVVNGSQPGVVGTEILLPDGTRSALSAPVSVTPDALAVLYRGERSGVCLDDLYWEEGSAGDPDGTTRYTYTPDANRLVQVDRPGGAVDRFGYTPWGGTAFKSERPDGLGTSIVRVTTHGYDDLLRLRSTSIDDLIGDVNLSTSTQDYYGPSSFRRSQTTNGSTTAFTWDGGGKLLTAQVDGGALRSVAHAPGGQWENTAGKTEVHVTDGRGNICGLAGTSGLTAWFRYDAWGQVTELRRGGGAGGWSAVVPSAGLRYRGQWYDGGDKGLYKMGARHYDPDLGRFSRSDPAEAGSNWYAYAGGDPVNRWDPSGLDDIATNGEGGDVIWQPELGDVADGWVDAAMWWNPIVFALWDGVIDIAENVDSGDGITVGTLRNGQVIRPDGSAISLAQLKDAARQNFVNKAVDEGRFSSQAAAVGFFVDQVKTGTFQPQGAVDIVAGTAGPIVDTALFSAQSNPVVVYNRAVFDFFFTDDGVTVDTFVLVDTVDLVEAYAGDRPNVNAWPYQHSRTYLGEPLALLLPFKIAKSRGAYTEMAELRVSVKRNFWSGGDVAREAAEANARRAGGTTLELTEPSLVGRSEELLSAGKDWFKEVRPTVWEPASKRFAEGADGVVDVFQSSEGVGLGSVWRQIEYPVLSTKSGVTIRYNMVMPDGTVIPVP